MHVRVRIFGKPDTVVAVESKLTKIDQFRKILKHKFDVEPKLQRLFYGGKLLENGYTFHDYNIKLNDVIQLMVKVQSDDGPKKEPSKDKISIEKEILKKMNLKDAKSPVYKVGDLVDVRDLLLGAWHEAKIVNVKEIIPEILEQQNSINDDPKAGSNKKSPEKAVVSPENNAKKKDIANPANLFYEVKMDSDNTTEFCQPKDIRPRARKVIKIEDLKVGQKVMINYNTEEPMEKGHWYDFKIEEIKKAKKTYELVGTLYLGAAAVPQSDTTVRIHDKVFAIEEVVPLKERSKKYSEMMVTPTEKRASPVNCVTCHDAEDAPCQDCGCNVCLGKQNPDTIILCDECDYGYHMTCLKPPLTAVPDDDWYCPSCKRDTNEVIAPGAAKQAKKTNASMSKRDWGRGMACVGKTKTSAMPANHFGPIPGIEVGMCWRFRIQLSETGVHRPPVSGIHGRDTDGAYSIVLSGGYEDDVDHGHEFTYTGSGGRDLSGNKRTAEQSCDQMLTQANRALARNCAVANINEKGADAGKDWRNGKPVRVVRSYKMRKHFPKYAPEEGIRYDGIYKVVKYYPEKGLSGFRVWKYLLRRDDPNPAPWEKGAKQYPIIFPDGYLEAEAEKKALKEQMTKPTKKRAKRKSDDSEAEEEASPPAKKRKTKARKDENSPPDNKAKTPPKSKSDKASLKSTANKTTPKNKANKPSPKNNANKPSPKNNANKPSPKNNANKPSPKNNANKPSPKNNANKPSPKNNANKPSPKSNADKTSPKNKANETTPKRKIASIFNFTNPKSAKKSPKNKEVKEADCLTNEEKEVIKADSLNCKLWDEAVAVREEKGKKEFIEHITEVFLCIICQDVAVNPVTTPCLHNFCEGCLNRGFKLTGSRSCPACRQCLAKYEPEINEQLKTALRTFMPGYDAGKK